MLLSMSTIMIIISCCFPATDGDRESCLDADRFVSVTSAVSILGMDMRAI
jgi:hypothetical protein